MKINEIILNDKTLIEVLSDGVLIRNYQDMLDLLGETEALYIVFHDHNFEPDFFDLSTKKMGEIFQKCTNYRIKIAIVGNFDKYPSKVLKQYIYETNKVGDFLFAENLKEISERWSKNSSK